MHMLLSGLYSMRPGRACLCACDYRVQDALFVGLLQPAAYLCMRDSDHRVPYRLLLESATSWVPKQPPSLVLSKPATRHRVEDIMEDISDNNRFAAGNRIDQWNAFYRHIDCAMQKVVVL